VYMKNTRILTGVNAFGIRLRHEVFDQWLTGKKTLDFVLDNLKDALFDPEFTPKPEFSNSKI
ncbi:MAG: hypothetical protein CVT92_15995, partial [Bacteroidetes bacterium HGW-Bacteroidetes-1]